MSGTSASIPASQIVSVTPGVIGAGGAALETIGLILSPNTRVPIGVVNSFPTALAVANFFGPGTTEAMLAQIYFNGFDNSNVKPGALLFAQYPQASIAAYLRGGNISGLTLAQLQALTGVLTISINGSPVTSSTINLAGATSFSNAAALISTGLGTSGPQAASFTGAISTTVLTVSAVATGALAIGNSVLGSGVTAGTTIVAQLTGTPGGIGTYTVSASQTIASEAMTSNAPACVYDSVSGAFVISSSTVGAGSTIGFATGSLSTGLLLTQATGALLSQGAIAAVPGTFMDGILAITRNWVSFMTSFEAVSADKIAFATWGNGQKNLYAYMMWDTNVVNTQAGAGSTSVQTVNAGDFTGVEMIYTNPAVDTIGMVAAFRMGCFASLDFGETNGRTTAAFRSQTGLLPQVMDATIAQNILVKGMNFYGAYSTANQQFVFYYNGSISGPFKWSDSYIDQVWMNSQFQLALMELLIAVKSIPFNNDGYALIKAACGDVITAALNFGAIRAGVSLSQAEAAEVNNAAGLIIAPSISRVGYYLQVLDPTAQVRQNRGTPQCTFWYTDGQSVQQINLASIEIL